MKIFTIGTALSHLVLNPFIFKRIFFRNFPFLLQRRLIWAVLRRAVGYAGE
jgi:hypothetical protein